MSNINSVQGSNDQASSALLTALSGSTQIGDASYQMLPRPLTTMPGFPGASQYGSPFAFAEKAMSMAFDFAAKLMTKVINSFTKLLGSALPQPGQSEGLLGSTPIKEPDGSPWGGILDVLGNIGSILPGPLGKLGGILGSIGGSLWSKGKKLLSKIF